MAIIYLYFVKEGFAIDTLPNATEPVAVTDTTPSNVYNPNEINFQDISQKCNATYKVSIGMPYITDSVL